MDRQIMLDKLSEFLMVEQAGYQLYTVVAGRASDPAIQERYLEFGCETSNHRRILAELIQTLGGDPDYVSPTARVAQVRGAQMLEIACKCSGLSAEELELADLESVVLAETKDSADWELLAQLAGQLSPGPEQTALQAAVDEVLAQEDEHVGWAKQTLAAWSLQMVVAGEARPERWERQWTGEHFTPDMHPAPMIEDDGLLPLSRPPQWQPALVSRAMMAEGQRRAS
jgi:hypothetical protein